MEDSFTVYTGDEVDWLVHSWIGNRKASILDMNATVFLGQQAQVPHMVIIFGSIPKFYFYAEYTPRDSKISTLRFVNLAIELTR